MAFSGDCQKSELQIQDYVVSYKKFKIEILIARIVGSLFYGKFDSWKTKSCEHRMSSYNNVHFPGAGTPSDKKDPLLHGLHLIS